MIIKTLLDMILKTVDTFLHNFDSALTKVTLKTLNNLIQPEVAEKIESIEIPKEDPFGIRKNYIKFAAIFSNFMYKHWNRVEVYGIDNVPDKGAGIIIANHGGVIPLDAAHIATSLIIEKKPGRLVRTLVERFLPRLPFVYTFMSRVGQVVGTYENAEIILDEGELLQIFPEGATGATKSIFKYYELDHFNVGFMELAIRKKVPIIPAGVVGSHEQALILFDFKPLAKLLKIPNFPVTPFWPLLGPAGAIPLPSKYRIIFGTPMDFSQYDEETINDPEKIKELVTQVKEEVRRLVTTGLEMRSFPFL